MLNKKVVLSILLLVLLGLSFAYYQYNKKVEGLEHAAPDYIMTANELFDAFDNDESAASLKYVDKIIEVTGEIARVKQSDSLSNVVLHADNALAGGINCSFKNKNGSLTKGETITLKGDCQGFLMDVILNNCYVDKG